MTKIFLIILVLLSMNINANTQQDIINRPKVGVGVLIIKDAKLLLGKRKNSHGPGTWALPGGHLEFGESIEECAKREVLEETGITILGVKNYSFTNDVFVKENKHYITIFVLATEWSGEPEVLEKDKCEAWAWFDVDKLPENLFLPLRNLVAQNSLLSLAR